jgi:hypothetical protein
MLGGDIGVLRSRRHRDSHWRTRNVDTTQRIDGIRDVAIANGRIAAVEANIAADAAQTLDARGKIVTAGMLDIHTHCGRDGRGPGLVLQDGVTAWIDAGSNGADKISDSVAVARSSPPLALLSYRAGRHPAGRRHDGLPRRVERLCASACGTTTTPSSSATTMSPGVTSAPAHTTGMFTEPSVAFTVPLAEIALLHTGNRISVSTRTSRTPASMTRALAPRALKLVARRSPK